MIDDGIDPLRSATIAAFVDCGASRRVSQVGDSEFEQKQAAYFRSNRRRYEEEQPAFMQSAPESQAPFLQATPAYGYQQRYRQERDLKRLAAELQEELKRLEAQREAAAARRQALLAEAEQLGQQLHSWRFQEEQLQQQLGQCRAEWAELKSQARQQQQQADLPPPFAAAGYQDPRATTLPEDFCPDDGTYELLTLHDRIPAEFIAEQLVDFKLYWQETGEARKGWQSRFRQHVVRRWKREQSEKQQRPTRSTVEKLTDRSWAQGFQFESGSESRED